MIASTQRVLFAASLLLFAGCVSTTSTHEREESGGAAPTQERILQFATSVSHTMNDRTATPLPINSYSHETAYGSEHLAEPPVYLTPNGEYSALASTDCSGWVSFVVNTVSPLHEAVLQSQRRLPEYNRAYPKSFKLHERERPWSRAFVLTNYFRTEHAKATGFEPVPDYEDLQFGDVGAYAMGRYADPHNSTLEKTKDTGHAFIVAGPASVVDPGTADYDGRGSLSSEAVEVIAVPVIDSSSVLHFDPDPRKNAEGRLTLPPNVPYEHAKPGGIGNGTLWFALDDQGRVLQRRIGPRGGYRDVVFGVARLRSAISLDREILDEDGNLVVELFDNTPTEYGGTMYGRLPIDLTGEGGLRLAAGGPLVLNGRSDFTGGVTVDSGEVVVASDTALGVGDVEVRGGRLRLDRAALHDRATLIVSSELEDGAVHLGFEGKDVVHRLQIGDEVHHCGTWGSLDSGATFVDRRFSGRGVLELTAEPSDRCAHKASR